MPRSRALSRTACWCLAGISPVSFQLWIVDGGNSSAAAIFLVPWNLPMIFDAWAMYDLYDAFVQSQRLFRMDCVRKNRTD